MDNRFREVQIKYRGNIWKVDMASLSRYHTAHHIGPSVHTAAMYEIDDQPAVFASATAICN